MIVDFGKKEFKDWWGKRSLTDIWRLSASTTGNSNTVENDSLNIEQNELDSLKEANPKYDVQFYLSKIPTDQTLLDSLAKDRNFAYYQLGLIYKEKFKEN